MHHVRREPREHDPVDRRTIYVSLLAVATAAGLAAQLLTRLIRLVTNVAFHGRIATSFVAPRGASLRRRALAVSGRRTVVRPRRSGRAAAARPSFGVALAAPASIPLECAR